LDTFIQSWGALEKLTPVGLNWLIREWDKISETLHRTLGSGSAFILRYIGMGIGKGYAEIIKSYELTFHESLQFLREYFIKRALGKLNFSEIKVENVSGRVAIQETSLRNPYSRYILYGIIVGFLEEVTEKKIHVREIKNEFPALIEAKFRLTGGEIK